MSERISVEIVTKDRPSELAMLLTSLLYQSKQDFDVVLVDEGQTPVPSYKFVADAITRLRLGSRAVKYVRNTDRRGIGHARNLAMENDDNEMVCRIDDDSVCDQHYLEYLYSVLTSQDNIGAAGGLVPVFGSPNPVRETKFVEPVFNKIVFSNDKVEVTDDGGVLYHPDKTLPSDHLRSSFMFRQSAAEKVGGFPDWCGVIGWREETVFCMKLKWAGWKLYTDTSALCWHTIARSGGARIPPDQYRSSQQLIEESFQKWALRKWKQNGEKY